MFLIDRFLFDEVVRCDAMRYDTLFVFVTHARNEAGLHKLLLYKYYNTVQTICEGEQAKAKDTVQ